MSVTVHGRDVRSRCPSPSLTIPPSPSAHDVRHQPRSDVRHRSPVTVPRVTVPPAVPPFPHRATENLRRDPRIAFVIGWDEEQTVQVQGVADEPSGAELARLKEVCFARLPDGRDREHWPDIAYFRARPTWARYSDFRTPEPRIVELAGECLRPRR